MIEKIIREMYSEKIINGKQSELGSCRVFCFSDSGWRRFDGKPGRFQIGREYQAEIHVSWYDQMFIQVRCDEGDLINLTMRMFLECFKVIGIVEEWRSNKIDLILC